MTGTHAPAPPRPGGSRPPAGGGRARGARGAHRPARRLAARDTAAPAAGALCFVALPSTAEEAIQTAWRVLGAAGDVPVVVAVTRRTDELDAFIAQADRIFLAA